MKRLRMLRHEPGAAAVEFILVVPLLIGLMFGIITFGFIFAAVLGSNNSAREAARFAVVDNRSCSQVAQLVQSSLSNTIGVTWPVTMTVSRPGYTTCTVVIAKTGTPGGSAAPICGGSNTSTDSVTIAVATTSSWGRYIPFFSNSAFPITGKGVFRCEYT